MNLTPIILTIHVLIVLGLIGLVLLQRSEGGALGIGGGGGGGFMSGRGAANALTRSTSVLAFLFFATSLGLAIIADQGESEEEIFREVTGASEGATDNEFDADDLRSIAESLGEGAPGDAAPADEEGDDPLRSITTDPGAASESQPTSEPPAEAAGDTETGDPEDEREETPPL